MFDRFFGTQLLRRRRRRRPAPLAAPVLDLRPPRGLHPDPAGVGLVVRDPADVLAEAALRLPGHGLLGHRSSASSASASGRTTCSPSAWAPIADAVFALDDDAHRDPDRREDLQLDRHDVGRLASASRRRCCSRSASSRCSPSAASPGVMHASPPADLQQTDTYFIVAHFHYVLFGGSHHRHLRAASTTGSRR